MEKSTETAVLIFIYFKQFCFVSWKQCKKEISRDLCGYKVSFAEGKDEHIQENIYKNEQ